MGLPGSVVPRGEDWIPRELRELRQMIERNAAARSAESTAIGAGGIRSSDFDGTGPDDLGTTGWMIGREPGGRSYLALNGVDVYASLSAQVAAILALVSAQVEVESFYAASSNFAVPNSWTTVLEHSLTTPAGFTQAVVTATAWSRIQNTSGGTAGFGTLAQINGVSGPFDDQSTPVSQFGNLQATYATLVSGLTDGETVPIRTRVFSSPALSADPDNEATINGVVLWLR